MLTLHGYDFPDVLCEALHAYLESSTSLESLVISYVGLSETGFFRICSGVSESSSIKEFFLESQEYQQLIPAQDLIQGFIHY